jgi:FAD/FMN-containing dehydrogenase
LVEQTPSRMIAQFHFLTNSRVQTAWAEPTCIVQPTTLEELQGIIISLVNANVTFAIRSGGHSPHHGWANIDNGALIDMRHFNRFEYELEKNVTTVGAGLTWGEVYDQLEVHQATVVGGRVLGVGVSGLTLGGMLTVIL